MATSLGGYPQYLGKVMQLLFTILEDENIPTEVKNIAIVAVGDICLVSEHRFVPYFQKSMQVLIAAGVLCMEKIPEQASIEDRRNINNLRQSLIDSFMSIINGIKCPYDDMGRTFTEEEKMEHFSQIRTMFFYLESLMNLEDLETNVEMAKQIIDLYCDIVMLQTQETSLNQREVSQFKAQVQASSAHRQIMEKFSAYGNHLRELDGGEAINRF